MQSLVYSLLYDLRQRCSYLLAELAQLEPKLPSEAQQYFRWLHAEVNQRQQEIELVLADPDLMHPRLAKQYHSAYKGMAQRLAIIEEKSFQALRHFDGGSQFLTRLVAKICAEGGYPADAPLCSTLSTGYYWAIPWANLIFASPSEATHLLALPDIYHELGHFILDRFRKDFVLQLLRLIDAHFQKLITAYRLKNWPVQSLAQLDDCRLRWMSSWHVEFACDVIAVYWVGPAFGWTNIRVCANISDKIFEGSSGHPADDARAKLIEETLRYLGLGAAADELAAAWREFIRASGQVPPQEYQLLYPPELIKQVAELTAQTCRQMGLIPHEPVASADANVAALMNSAWSSFRNNPETFAADERKLLATLQSIL